MTTRHIGAACEVDTPNIGPGQVRLRRIVGTAYLGMAAVGLALLTAIGADPVARLLLFLPVWDGALAWFEAREKTCTRLAALGLRETGCGITLMDKALRGQAQRQARRVQVRALITAGGATALLWLFPF